MLLLCDMKAFCHIPCPKAFIRTPWSPESPHSPVPCVFWLAMRRASSYNTPRVKSIDIDFFMLGETVTMQKKALLALLIALMLLMSSCSLIQKDMAVDAATEIVKVADVVYTKGDIQEMVQSYLQQQQAYYAQYYGYNIDITSDSVIASAQDEVIQTAIEQAVTTAKAKELGLDTLNEEDQAEVDDLWQQYYDLVKNYMFADTELEGEELENAINDSIQSTFGVNKETLVASKVRENLRNEVVKDVTVSDDEVKTEFDTRVENAKSTYANSLSAYGSAYNNDSSTIYYRPAGYRLVKQILVKFTDEDDTMLDELDSKISTLNSQISSYRSDLENANLENLDELLTQVTSDVTIGLPNDGAVAPELIATTTDMLSDDTEESVKSLLLYLREAEEKLSVYQKLRDETQAAAYEHIDADADDILAQLANGADWDTLMAEKTQDPGMQSGKTSETGYAVCENMSGFDSAFVNAAMALEKVGDYSDKVASDLYGYYIIRYEGDVEEGPVDLADVQETIHDELLESKQNETYDAAVAQWVTDANAFIDKKSLNN